MLDVALPSKSSDFAKKYFFRGKKSYQTERESCFYIFSNPVRPFSWKNEILNRELPM